MRLLLTFSLIVLLAACAPAGLEKHNGYLVDIRHPAYGARPRISVLVIHYTAEDLPSALATLTDREVSVHYLIPARPVQNARQPVVFRLVSESQLAWHAGRSFWRGATRINDISVGIELENHGFKRTTHGIIWYPFPAQQMEALLPLLRDIVGRYHILPQNVVGHSDIAPQRKQDPGPLFSWQWLAEQGVGAWPDAKRVAFFLAGRTPQQLIPPARLLNLLADYGYEVTPEMTSAQRQKVIAAFQIHFRPSDYRGLADAQTEAIAEALLEKYADKS